MPITISCSCGKLLKVPDELAGKQGRCPGCGEVLEIPKLPPGAPMLEAVKDNTTGTAFYTPGAIPGSPVPAATPAPVPAGHAPPPSPPAWAYAAPPVTSGLAIASLITSFLCGPVGMILGIVSMVQVKGSQGRQTGFGMALAGTIIGVLWTILAILVGIAVYVMWGVLLEAGHAARSLDEISRAQDAYFKQHEAYWTKNIRELTGLASDIAAADGKAEDAEALGGYLFIAMETEDDYAVCAYPVQPRAFSMTLIMNKKGAIFWSLLEGKPQKKWPDPSMVGPGRHWQPFDFDRRIFE